MSEPPTVSIFLVEDQIITRTGLKFMLGQVPGFSIVGEAGDGKEAVNLALQLKPSIILMDIAMPEMDGIEATRQIKAAMPEARILMLTSYERDDDVFASLAAGADGYCMKTITAEQLTVAIKAVLEGAAWLDPAIAKRVVKACGTGAAASGQKSAMFALSPRELDVLRILVNGKSNQEIADELVVSPETVKTHMRHIMEKLMVSDRTQAAVKALREGLV